MLLAGNPLEDIARTRAIEGVLVRGRWLPKDELESGLKDRAAEYAREEAFMSRITRTGFAGALAYMREVRARDAHAFVFRPEGVEALALLFAVIGNHAEERKAAELAVAEFPERWTAWTRLAEACSGLGDGAAARAALERARALHPDDARLARALEALAPGPR